MEKPEIVLRNYRGAITTCVEPDPYNAMKYNDYCDERKLRQRSNDMDGMKSTGIARLISHYNEYTPIGLGKTKRFQRYGNVG